MGVGGFQNFVRKSLCGRPNLPTPDWHRVNISVKNMSGPVFTPLNTYCHMIPNFQGYNSKNPIDFI